ncbi:hypothetical protein HPT27_09070 [Permianibacter sp. IMCC34836]|uniref:hypothetical protein n=1 Tax=Permianibacter fluminis TaxID=2738515 RepID=UPI001555FCF9|nr:hypothetical protein [Permianibacter fluminis]NQD37176.1 hypothetical protein [Permianibacter fluminis]
MSVLRTLLLEWPQRWLRRGLLAFWHGIGRSMLQQLRRRLAPPLDWRLLIWLAGFALIGFGAHLPWLQRLDQQLFRLGTALLPTEPRAQAIDVLELSLPEMQQLLRDPVASGSTTALLYALTGRQQSVAVLLPELPRSQASSAERLLQDTPVDAPIHQAWAAREQLRARLSDWLASPQVFLALPGLPPYLGADAQFIDDASGNAAALPFWQRLSAASVPVHPSLAVAVGGGAFHLWPIDTARIDVATAEPLTQQLFWRHGDNLYPSLSLALLRASRPPTITAGSHPRR